MSNQENFPTPKILRPKQAAALAGYSLPTFYRRKNDDPNFPRIVCLGFNSRAKGVFRDEWIAYIDQFFEETEAFDKSIQEAYQADSIINK